ncbi:MAG: hypothetical protein ACWA41_05750 [Putridiphycobacter sp.]
MNIRFFTKIDNVIAYTTHIVVLENKIKFLSNNITIENPIGIINNIFQFNEWHLLTDKLNKPYLLKSNDIEDSFWNTFRIGGVRYPLVEYYKKESPRKYGVFNFESDKVLFETTEWIGRDIIDDYIFSDYQNIITCRENFSGKKLWKFNLNQFGTYKYGGDDLAYEIVQFIGIWQGKLLVQLTNARLIALDINTGELLHDIEINKINPLPEKKTFYDQYVKIHLVEDKIIWLTNQTLLQINLNTFTVRIINEFYSLLRENQWRFMHNTYFEGKLYFTADYAWQYVTPSYVGVMDATSGEVLWSQQLENTGGLPEAPKVTNDKLYIRTNNNTLHIFEKV